MGSGQWLRGKRGCGRTRKEQWLQSLMQNTFFAVFCPKGMLEFPREPSNSLQVYSSVWPTDARLRRIGVAAIGRAFAPDLALGGRAANGRRRLVHSDD